MMQHMHSLVEDLWIRCCLVEPCRAERRALANIVPSILAYVMIYSANGAVNKADRTSRATISEINPP